MFASLLTRTTPPVRVSFHLEDKAMARPRIQVRDDRGAIVTTMTYTDLRAAMMRGRALDLTDADGAVVLSLDGFTIAAALDAYNRRMSR